MVQLFKGYINEKDKHGSTDFDYRLKDGNSIFIKFYLQNGYNVEKNVLETYLKGSKTYNFLLDEEIIELL